MSKNFGIYGFSSSPIKIESHEYLPNEFEIIDLKLPYIYYEHSKENKKDHRSVILWNSYSLLKMFGLTCEYCIKIKNTDPNKLILFRLRHDAVKLCAVENIDSIAKLQELTIKCKEIEASYSNIALYKKLACDFAINDTNLASEIFNAFINFDDFKKRSIDLVFQEFTQSFCIF